MTNFLVIFLSIPKTLYFNFRHLPIRFAMYLPIWIHYKTYVRVKGKIIVPDHPHPFMIRIGFHKTVACNNHDETRFTISKQGRLKFEGTAHIGRGSKIGVVSGELILGDNFAISASSTILCYKGIRFGRDIQFSWDCLVMDSDTHKIYDEMGRISNQPKEIVFGDKIWICNGCMILKGTQIPDNCVIGAHSVVSGNKFEKNRIIVGNPAKEVKNIMSWEL